MKIKEIRASELNTKKFILEKSAEISRIVGKGLAINALSGGVDSSVVTMLGHLALGRRLKTYFINNGIMRQGEPERVAAIFRRLGVEIKILNAQDKFFKALKGITDPEEKREAITQTFYKDVFGKLVRLSGAKYLLQGTILTDIDETVAGIKRQHNVFEQLGIDPQKAFGYKIIEPLVELRKDGVRKVAQGVGLPKEIYQRMPFPGPALSARVIGEVTPEKIKVVRLATLITEEELRLMIEVGKEEGVLSDEERKMLHRIFEFGDTKVTDVMVPKGKMVAVNIKTTPEELLNIFVEEGHARLPVYSGAIDNIIGIIYARDLLYILRDKGLFLLQDLVHKAYYVPEGLRVNELLRKFQADKVQIAIVVDAAQKALGLLTLEDLTEEIVGEIEEKHTSAGFHK